MREEYRTAHNIKSKVTRNHVLDALTKIVERLRIMSQPANGLVMFCGYENEFFRFVMIEPAVEITTSFYRCDDHFYTEPLEALLREDELIGIIALDNREAGFGLLHADRLDVIESIDSGVAGKHNAGGQSQRRYERLRDMKLNEYMHRIADHAKKHFINNNKITGLIIAGDGYTKLSFLSTEYLDYRLKQSILGIIDTSYAGTEGVRDAFTRSTDILAKHRLVHEKQIVDKIFSLLPQSMVAYGNDVERLDKNMINYIVILDTTDPTELELRYPEKRIETISSTSEYGQMLASLGAVVAILKYPYC